MARAAHSSKPKQHTGWFDRALERYQTAHLTEAAEIIDEAIDQHAALSDEAVLLRARLHLIQKPPDAIAFLTDALKRLRTTLAGADGLILLGSAYAQVDDFRNAKTKFDLAERSLTGHSRLSEELKSALVYRRASALWMQRKIPEAERELSIALEAPAPDSHVEALILRGALYAARERYESQGGVLLEALRVAREAQPVNVFRWAHVTAQLTYLARELPNTSIRNAAFEDVERIPWTSDLRDVQFTALKAVGWRRALEGDYFNAFRYLKKASVAAPTTAWRVMAGCDRAYLAASLGEPRFAEQELGEAANLAESVEWRALSGEQRFALLLLAELYAPHDGALAMSYVARFRETGTKFSTLLSSNADRRVEAMVAYSLGSVHYHLQELDEATKAYKESFTIYNAIGYEWRAARAAIGLAQATGDVAWYDVASKKLQNYPMSWLTAQLTALIGRGGNPSVFRREMPDKGTKGAELTPAQREVYELLLRGFSTRKIADELDRSEFTVRNHIKAVFKKLGVNSRVALMTSSMN